MKVLNLYAGIGGNRKLWKDVDVTAVELNPEIAKIYQDFFPQDKVIVADAHQYLLEHFEEYDFIWSSPPCPSHSRVRKATRHQNPPIYPDMKLLNVIGGLEKKKPIGGGCDSQGNMSEGNPNEEIYCEGHNQLCNREVELDLDWLRNKLCLELQTKIVRRILEDFSEAISQGKVLKLTKEE